MKLSNGNIKLAKTIATWSIPASQEVCGRVCQGCYSYKAQKRFPAVLQARHRNLEFSKTKEFTISVSRGTKYVRVHADGEFYSQEYVNKWVKIAKSMPEVVFYAYTKRMKDFDFSEVKSLSNFVLHNSVLEDGSYNFGKNIVVKGGYVCPDTLGQDVKCGDTCTWCMNKANENTQILFEQH